MIYEQTTDGSNRLWLKRTEMPESFTQKGILFTVLDSFSIWGGADVNEADQMGWEFHKGIGKTTILLALSRCGCKIEESSLRETAIEWWHRKLQWTKSSNEGKDNLCNAYYPGRHASTLTGREIEEIYKKENKK